jgi:hypothetical protein
MSGIRNQSILLCVAALLVASGPAAATASASRAPTPQEKHEIVAVSQRIQRAPGSESKMQCGIGMPASAMRELGLGTNCAGATQRALAIAASCSRVVKYDGGAFQGGFYRYRDMSCHEAHSIVREYFEHGLAPRGFRCSEVSPRPTRPEGATLCTSGRPLVEFAGE